VRASGALPRIPYILSDFRVGFVTDHCKISVYGTDVKDSKLNRRSKSQLFPRYVERQRGENAANDRAYKPSWPSHCGGLGCVPIR
jgi:hypothetical protein